jgi:phospholipid/cholesterol/gamma-HCH transport system substrate-binding protein
VKFSKEIKVALLGIAAIVALYVGFMVLKGSDLFSRTRTFHAIYQTVDGLNVSNPVLLSGIAVGHVQGLQILHDQGNHVLVTMDINKDVVVGDSTIAILSSSDLLGSKAIVLNSRNHSTLYEGGDTLISFVERSITEIITEKSAPLLGTIDTTLMKLNSLFEEDSKRNIQGIIRNTEATTAALKDLLVMNQRNIQQITANLSALTGSLRRSEQDFSRISANLAQMTDSLKELEISQMVRAMNTTVQEAQALVQKMNSETGSLGKLVNNDSLYQNLNRFSADLDKLMVDIRERPGRYVHFSVFGRKDKYTVENAENVERARNVQTAEKVDEVKR